MSEAAPSIWVMGAKRHRNKSSGGSGAVFAVLVLIAIVIKFIWWILGGLALVALFFLVRAVVREDRKRRLAYAAYCAQLAARADQQHNWVLQGDDRGIYGPEGARLMRLIAGA